MTKTSVLQAVQYAWRDGYRAKIDAQVAGEAIIKLAGADDSTTAKEIIRVAKAPTHPLHPAFNWDDADAANEYRLLQARNLVNSIRIVEPETGALQRLFVHVAHEELNEPAYITVEAVMQRPELRDVVLERAKADLKAWRTRYSDLQELAEVYAVIDRVAG